MDENQQQSKANKSADEVVSSIVNIFLHYYALVIKRYMLCLIYWCKHHFPLVLLMI